MSFNKMLVLREIGSDPAPAAITTAAGRPVASGSGYRAGCQTVAPSYARSMLTSEVEIRGI